jgi:hypothetical protein
MTQKKILILFYDSDIWIPISVNVSRSERLFRLLEVDMLRIALALIICLISFGCATVNVKTLDKKEDCCDTGIRYYERAPFLLVYSDGKGGVVTKVHYLPDRNKLRSVHPFNFMASNKNTLNFKDGMLEDSTNIIDATAVPKAVIKAVETVASTVLKGMADFVATEKGHISKFVYVLPPPELYRIYIKGEEVELVGGAGKGPPIQFNLQTQEEVKK